MKKFYCVHPHNPPESYGDCIRACIASMVGDNNCPHTFTGGNTHESWKSLRGWLRLHHDKQLVLMPVESPFEFMEMNNPGVAYMLICSTNGGDHALICKDGVVIHDPNMTQPQITGPHSSGLWVVGLLV